MSKETDTNLPSTTTMGNNGGKRCGDLFTTENEEETLLAIKVREMLNITKLRTGQVNERDLS